MSTVAPTPVSFLTVALCARDPRRAILREVLSALARAMGRLAIPVECLVVDDGSREPLSGWTEVTAVPGTRVMRRESIGIGEARRLALREARGDLVMFLDDDTVPADDYLEVGVAKAAAWPMLGAWGGQLRPPPGLVIPSWLQPHRRLLAFQEMEGDAWGLVRRSHDALPASAGMFLRPEVGREWIRQVDADPRRRWLGSHGRDPRRGEDTDLAWCAHDLGLGTAIFGDLVMEHHVDPSRFAIDAFVKQVEGSACSAAVLLALRGHPMPAPSGSRLQALARRLEGWSLGPEERRIRESRRRGHARAGRVLAELGPAPGAR